MLSRYPAVEARETDPMKEMVSSVSVTPLRHEDIAVLQQEDPTLSELIMKLRDGMSADTQHFTIYRNALYRKNYGPGREKLLVVPFAVLRLVAFRVS